MKTKNIIYIFFITCSFIWTSCSDFLEIKPENIITEDNFFQSEDDFKAATAPLYTKVWFDFNSKFYFGMGDGRSYNLYAPFSDYVYPFSDLTETGLTGPLVNAWASLYNVVQQSNNVIIGIKNSTVNETTQEPYLAEARFMRGTAYWYLASLWGNVILSENPQELIANPIVNTSSIEDVYEFAMRDLEYAAKYLPQQASQAGRLTNYSAFGMLSRVYLSRSGISDNPNSGTRNQTYLDLAKLASEKVINEGPYELMDDYADLFMIENNNNSESIFALQWVPNAPYGSTNGQQAFFAVGSEITGDDAAWGSWTRASYNILEEYESNDARRRATWMADGDVYPEINKANGGYTYDLVGQVNVKKGVVGSTKDNSNISRMNSALNTYMMRYAEVHLNYAEAILGNSNSTADANALISINLLRTRAGLNEKTNLTYADIIHERRVELCMEGQFWYDLVRRAYYRQQEVINYITSQERGTIIPFLYDSSTNTITEDLTKERSSRSVGSVDETIFLLPYPESEVVQNPLLKEAPVAYEFTEERITDLFN